MFQKGSLITIAADNYSDVQKHPINHVTRKQSIASYNYPQKILFFSHINKVVNEKFTAEFKLVRITAVNTKGFVFSVICDDQTEIAISKGIYVSFAKVADLRSSSSILVDEEGFPCKIVSIEPFYGTESEVFDVRSNKGNSKFVNGLMFKA
jgi:hypothetical protein